MCMPPLPLSFPVSFLSGFCCLLPHRPDLESVPAAVWAPQFFEAPVAVSVVISCSLLLRHLIALLSHCAVCCRDCALLELCRLTWVQWVQDWPVGIAWRTALC